MGWRTSVLTSIAVSVLTVLVTLRYQEEFLPEHLRPIRTLPSAQDVSTPTTVTPQGAVAVVDIAQTLSLGRVLLARGEAEEAALAFRLAAANVGSAHDEKHLYQGSTAAEAHYGLGLALRAAGRPGEALSACREAERLDPNSAPAAICVGALLTEIGDVEAALTTLRRAAQLEPSDGRVGSGGEAGSIGGGRGEASRRLGAALLAAGYVEEAIPVLMRALTMNSGDAHSAYNLGVAWQNEVHFEGFQMDCLQVMRRLGVVRILNF